MNVQNASLTIRDEGDFNYRLNDADLALGQTGLMWIWDGQNTHPPGWKLVDSTMLNSTFPAITGLGYMWGYVNYIAEGGTGGVFAPLPIFFEDVNINVSSSHYSGELMYTYRAHPFAWGSMELLAGARYWEFKDSFGFAGTTLNGAPAPTPSTVPRSALNSMIVDAEGINRIVGPQVGIKLCRQNARWSFGAEGRLTGGINVQSVKTQGSLQPRTISFTGPEAGGQWGPLGLQNSNYNFGHKQNKTYVSPIAEFRFSADWQWTSAVSFFGAVDAMWAGNIARSVRVTDYVVQSDGTIFGIRGNDRNTSVAVYGLEAGIKVVR
jgi:hypothetical protein